MTRRTDFETDFARNIQSRLNTLEQELQDAEIRENIHPDKPYAFDDATFDRAVSFISGEHFTSQSGLKASVKPLRRAAVLEGLVSGLQEVMYDGGINGIYTQKSGQRAQYALIGLPQVINDLAEFPPGHYEKWIKIGLHEMTVDEAFLGPAATYKPNGFPADFTDEDYFTLGESGELMLKSLHKVALAMQKEGEATVLSRFKAPSTRMVSSVIGGALGIGLITLAFNSSSDYSCKGRPGSIPAATQSAETIKVAAVPPVSADAGVGATVSADAATYGNAFCAMPAPLEGEEPISEALRDDGCFYDRSRPSGIACAPVPLSVNANPQAREAVLDLALAYAQSHAWGDIATTYSDQFVSRMVSLADYQGRDKQEACGLLGERYVDNSVGAVVGKQSPTYEKLRQLVVERMMPDCLRTIDLDRLKDNPDFIIGSRRK